MLAQHSDYAPWRRLFQRYTHTTKKRVSFESDCNTTLGLAALHGAYSITLVCSLPLLHNAEKNLLLVCVYACIFYIVNLPTIKRGVAKKTDNSKPALWQHIAAGYLFLVNNNAALVFFLLVSGESSFHSTTKRAGRVETTFEFCIHEV